MSIISYKTVSANKSTANKEWLVIDAEGQYLGRFASKIAKLLRGKHKTNFTPHVDCGDNVVVINVGKILLSGNKSDQKEYLRYTGYPGGQRFTSFDQMKQKDATKIIQHAVKGMLPKNKLGRALLKNLYLFEGVEHNKEAQQPKSLDINTFI